MIQSLYSTDIMFIHIFSFQRSPLVHAGLKVKQSGHYNEHNEQYTHCPRQKAQSACLINIGTIHTYSWKISVHPPSSTLLHTNTHPYMP